MLDFGCGAGASTVILSKLLPASRITGVELHASNLEGARAEFYGLDHARFMLSPSSSLCGSQISAPRERRGHGGFLPNGTGSKRRGYATVEARPRDPSAWDLHRQPGFNNTPGSAQVVTIAADASLRLARYKRRAHFATLVARRGGHNITSWHDFHVATADVPLLAHLDDYPDSLLIAGCDWSAVTAITRLFKRLPAFADSSWGHDDELDGALLLAGLRERPMADRHCFQTSYVRERYREYFAHDRFRLVWIVREPRAAVRSLLVDGQRTLPHRTALGLAGKSSGGQGVSRLEKACATYVASIRQTLELKERLGERVAVIDYDELVADRRRLLPALCRFASVRCDSQVLRHLHGKSARKGALASWEGAIVDELALPVYRRARVAATLSLAHA